MWPGLNLFVCAMDIIPTSWSNCKKRSKKTVRAIVKQCWFVSFIKNLLHDHPTQSSLPYPTVEVLTKHWFYYLLNLCWEHDWTHSIAQTLLGKKEFIWLCPVEDECPRLIRVPHSWNLIGAFSHAIGKGKRKSRHPWVKCCLCTSPIVLVA